MKGGVNVVHIITNTITATTKNSEVGVTVAPLNARYRNFVKVFFFVQCKTAA
jgi:hypothetical protein